MNDKERSLLQLFIVRSQIGVCEALIDANINVEMNIVISNELAKQGNKIEEDLLSPRKDNKLKEYKSS